jgi:predicted amidohydrolase
LKISILHLPDGCTQEEWLRRFDAAADMAAREGVRLVVLPERSFPSVLPGTRSLEPLRRISKERQLHVLVGFAERVRKRRYESVALLTSRGRCKGVVRQRLLVPPGFSRGGGPNVLEVGNTRVAVVVGSDWQSTVLLRGALVDPLLRVVLVVAQHDAPEILEWARTFAASDSVFVVVCNGGASGSIAVAPGGAVLCQLAPDDERAVVDLGMPQIDPISTIA